MLNEIKEQFVSNVREQNAKEMASAKTEKGNLVPQVVDEKRAWDVFSKLLEKRIIRVDGEVNDGQAAIVCSSLMFLDSTEQKGEPIDMLINSPGGSVYSGLAMYDTMRTITSPVHTHCLGMAASMGSLLLVAGDKRFASPNAKIMIHQPSGGTGRAQATDITIASDSIQETWDILSQIYVDHTGVSHDVWDDLLERDNYLTVEQALDIGIIDGVVEHTKPKPFAGIERTAPRATHNEKLTDVFKSAKKERDASVAAVAKIANDDNVVPALPAAKKTNKPKK